ncbi:MAG: hypothetical protein JSS83_19175 [Cyanobacteria bacterium SZAS LIN-3]|nr:hypothetical protein [Cyanobacteria bacterium SZAS LIN-3]
MSKTPILITIAAVAGISAAAAAFIIHRSEQNATDVHFAQGQPRSQIFLPVQPRKEERIIRHPQADGSAVDDVLMRDGTTKQIVYDKQMTLREVRAYFKAALDQERGPLMYTKQHDETGHLSAERHLRLDGSLEMEGRFNPDKTYVRTLYYPGKSANARDLVVMTEQVFDKWWHPEAQTDYRPDGTKKLVHTWGDGLEEMFNNFAEDGKTLVSQVELKRGSYYTALYYPDGVNIMVEGLNTYEGSTFQWYRPDHSLRLKVTYTNASADEIILTDDHGKLLYKQVWYKDYSGGMVNGTWPLRLDHLDHFNDQGAVDIRYEFSSGTKRLQSVTYFEGTELYGQRTIYSVGFDGVRATTVQHYDKDNKGDGGKPATGALSKSFTLEPGTVKYPEFQLPPMKEGLSLYGQRYMFRDR